MDVVSKKGSLPVLIGDIFFLFAGLWLLLVFRYGGLPNNTLWEAHLTPFSILFVAWVLVFFIGGLYERQTYILKKNLSRTIFNAQVVNIIIAVFFFYFIPYFGITPKTNLFLYLIVSSLLILVWRLYILPSLGFRKRQNAVIIGGGTEIIELEKEMNSSKHYSTRIVRCIDLNSSKIDKKEDIINSDNNEEISAVYVDFESNNVQPILYHLYNLLFSGVKVSNVHNVYEAVFDRVPVSLVGYNWFLKNVSSSAHLAYDLLKRSMDVLLAILLGLISLLFYPFVYLGIKLEDGGPMLICQERMGQNNKKIKILKFRSMNSGDRGVWVKSGDVRVTKVGKFLRKTRIDELPQLWNILRGDLSFIGPRPDIIGQWEKLVEQIPYYSTRNLIKPGLSGWAQIKQKKPPQSMEETRLRLAYDFYYIKNRSFILDVVIALKTIRILLSRTGI